jgi:hypothetical protein
VFRQNTTIDEVGDQDVVKSLAYAELEANVQPQESDISYEIEGVVHRQTHSAYINRVVLGTVREIKPTDIVIDMETGMNWMLLGIQNWQAASNTIEDSHHIKLVLKQTTGFFDITKFKTVKAKAKIV